MVFKNGVEEEKIRGADPNKLQRVVKDLVSIANGPASASGSGSGSGPDRGWRTGDLPKGYGDVTDQVDVKSLELLNADDAFGTVRVLFESAKPSALDKKGKSHLEAKDWIESDTDEQLMLYAQFQAQLKIHTVQVRLLFRCLTKTNAHSSLPFHQQHPKTKSLCARKQFTSTPTEHIF